MKFVLTIPTFFVLLASLFSLDAQGQYYPLRGMNTVSSLLTEQDVRDVSRYRVNVLRYALSWGNNADTANLSEYLTWLNSDLDKLDALMPVLKEKRIKLILSVGTPPGGFVSHNPPLPQMRIFSEAWAQNALIEIWTQIATRYKDNNVIQGFQLVSEPAIGSKTGSGLMNWYKLQKELGKTIRKVDKKHFIVVGAEYAHPGKLSKIKYPKSLGKTLYSIHFYYPVSFLIQSPDTGVNKISYPNKSVKKKNLKNYLAKAIKFQKKKKVNIVVSEFTTTRYAPRGSSVRYLKDTIDIFEKYKWSWMYHAWREAPVWSIEHEGDGVSPTVTNRGRTLYKYFKKNKRPVVK